LRIVGNVTDPNLGTGGPEQPAVAQTGQNMMNAYVSSNVLILDSIDVQSGTHRTPTGQLSPTPWDPYTHTYGPLDVLTTVGVSGSNTVKYRVTSSDHRLTATIWQTTHTLEKYAAPAALP
jgi:hypothetical protein